MLSIRGGGGGLNYYYMHGCNDQMMTGLIGGVDSLSIGSHNIDWTWGIKSDRGNYRYLDYFKPNLVTLLLLTILRY